MCGLVRRRGLEPLCLAALAPQASASANFATSALSPAHKCGVAVSNPKISIPSDSGFIDSGRVGLRSVEEGTQRPRIKAEKHEMNRVRSSPCVRFG